MKRILVVSAMKKELMHIDLLRFEENLFKHKMYIGDNLITGVGKINATMNLTKKLFVDNFNNKPYDAILNLGTSGGVKNCDLLDVVYGELIRSVDVDYCNGEFCYGYNNILERCSKIIRPSIMLSNDKFLTKEYCEDKIIRHIEENFVSPVVYDMETFALAKVANSYNIPFISVRVVTDKPDFNDSYSVFKKNIERGMSLVNKAINTRMFLEGLYEILEG